jgi:hypothetical protein
MIFDFGFSIFDFRGGAHPALRPWRGPTSALNFFAVPSQQGMGNRIPAASGVVPRFGIENRESKIENSP